VGGLIVEWRTARYCPCGGHQAWTVHLPGDPTEQVIPCPHCTDATPLQELLEKT
jgi:hypothetical protein